MAEGVLIAGGGPVGMTLASELTRYGIPVRILDRAAARTDKSKALVLWSRTLELLDRSSDGGAGPFVAAGCRAEAVNILNGSQVIGRIGMGGVDSPFPYGLMLPQSETERLLEERLAQLRLDLVVWWGCVGDAIWADVEPGQPRGGPEDPDLES